MLRCTRTNAQEDRTAKRRESTQACSTDTLAGAVVVCLPRLSLTAAALPCSSWAGLLRSSRLARYPSSRSKHSISHSFILVVLSLSLSLSLSLVACSRRTHPRYAPGAISSISCCLYPVTTTSRHGTYWYESFWSLPMIVRFVRVVFLLTSCMRLWFVLPLVADDLQTAPFVSTGMRP